ncbi:MAG: hypothetical protein NT069_01290 [Planctomycetota bacterium]|nr:hypothetical protein [Planctomycetota bacterium]
MSRKKKRRNKSPGHYCWACDCFRANERFSGKGHSRHVCKECWRLGAVELSVLQTLHTLENAVTNDGGTMRCFRPFIRQQLNHDDLRVRAFAEEVLRGVPVGNHVVELTEEEFVLCRNEHWEDTAPQWLINKIFAYSEDEAEDDEEDGTLDESEICETEPDFDDFFFGW